MKTVMLSYVERNKVVKIPDSCDGKELEYLEEQFRKLFSYEGNISINISFHQYNSDWNEFMELDYTEKIDDKDKLKVIVTPQLVTPTVSTPKTSLAEDDSSICSPPSTSTPVSSRTKVIDSDDEMGCLKPQSKRRILVNDDNDLAKENYKKRRVSKSEEDMIPLPEPFPNTLLMILMLRLNQRN